MIALALLAGGAVFLAAHAWAGQDLVVAIGLALLVIVIGVSVVDVLQDIHDRRTAYRRWREWDR